MSRRIVFALLTLVAGALGGALGWAGFLAATGNVHSVIDGELYRSGQLGADALASLIEARSIRTVINLEGEQPQKAWYRAERQVTEAAGADHLDFHWSASRVPSPSQVDAFLAAVRTARRPILIHCRSGSDRTGLAVALYLAAVTRAGEDTAEGQLSFTYGHVGIPYTAAFAMDVTFEREERRLGLYPDS